MKTLERYWPVGAVALALLCVTALTLKPYNGNVTALFHLDQQMAEIHPVPEGFVVLQMPGYDGMQYYEIARMMPDIVQPSHWSMLKATVPLSYAYQRILLPVAAYVLSLGMVSVLPYAFLFINIAALLATCFLVLRWKPDAKLYAMALALCPAALLAIHFSLAEPLTLVLLTAFLIRRFPATSKSPVQWKLDVLDIVLLSLLILSREVNVLFIGLLIVWSLWKRQWRSCALIIIPLAIFAAWHSIIYLIFGDIPFLTSAAKHALPFQSLFEVLRGVQGYNQLTASSIAYALFFYLPAIIWICIRIVRRRSVEFLEFAALAFLGLMSVMSWDIWGSMTSIGRVITPVYPLVVLYAAKYDSWAARWIACALIALGLGIGIALALIVHPFLTA